MHLLATLALSIPQAPLTSLIPAVPENFGMALHSPGDVDGDGFEDLLVGAPGADVGAPNSGRVRLYSGAWLAVGQPPELLHDWIGVVPWAGYGSTLGGGGDVDGDGVPDVLVGAPSQDAAGLDSGRVEVRSGASGAILASLFEGAHAAAGASLATIADLNGDGYDEVLVGAPGLVTPGGSYTGRARVYSGEWIATTAAGGQPQSARILHVLAGVTPGGSYGHAVAALRDLDGDGVGEIAVGAPQHVVHGAGYVDVRSGASGQLLARLDGDASRAHFGAALARAGDWNGDGFDDLAVGSPFHDWFVPDARRGRVQVFSGEWIRATAAGIPPQTQRVLADLRGDLPEDRFGRTIELLDDLDGDGRPELAVGGHAPGPGVAAGFVSLVAGGSGAVLGQWSGPMGAHFGVSLARVSDLDGDGLADLAVGAPLFESGGEADTGRVDLFSSTTPPTGRAFCFGSECPCGNEDAGAGCASSLGTGARLDVLAGGASVAIDDLALLVRPLPPSQPLIFFMGNGGAALPFADGRSCVRQPIHRFPLQVSSALGSAGEGPGIVAHSRASFPLDGHIAAGDARAFQVWYRDPGSVCGAGSNLSSALAVRFAP